MKKLLTITAMSAALMLAACGGGGDKAADTGDTAKADAAGDATATAAAGATGIPECDAYLTKVMACIDGKVPEAQRAQLKQAIESSKASWAAIPDKAAAGKACQTAMDQAKASYGAMGCEF